MFKKIFARQKLILNCPDIWSRRLFRYCGTQFLRLSWLGSFMRLLILIDVIVAADLGVLSSISSQLVPTKERTTVSSVLATIFVVLDRKYRLTIPRLAHLSRTSVIFRI